MTVNDKRSLLRGIGRTHPRAAAFGVATATFPYRGSNPAAAGSRGVAAVVAGILGAAGLAVAGGAFAQTAQSTPTLAPASAQSTAQSLQEVVVTATATSVRRLDASYNIVAASQQQIAMTDPASTADIYKLSPGVWPESSGGETGVNIDVAGFPLGGGDSPYFTTMIEGTPLYGSPFLSFMDNSSLTRMDDTVERVEIVQGGPSAIFGPGQPGATANFILRTGSDHEKGSLGVTYGSEGMYRVDAFESGKLTDGWYGSIGGFYRQSDGVRDPQYLCDVGGQLTATLKHDLDHGSIRFWARTLHDHNQWVADFPYTASNGSVFLYPGFNQLDSTYNSKQLQNFQVPDPACNCFQNDDISAGRGAYLNYLGSQLKQDFGGGWSISNNFIFDGGMVPTHALVNNGNPATLSSYIGTLTLPSPLTTGMVQASFANGQPVNPAQSVVTQQSGELHAAHERLQGIVAAQPAFPEGLRLLAGTKLALGDAQEAEALLRRALQLDPQWTATHTTLGELLLASGRGGEAQIVLEGALAGGSADPRAALLLARYYNDTGRPARALALAAPFCTVARLDPQLATQHVIALIALGRQAEALSFYGQLASAAPDSAAPAQALAFALNAAGRHVQAGQIAHRALARGSKSATLCLSYAKSLMAQGAHERAEAALRDCLRLEPRLTEAHNSLAQLLWLRTGDLAAATEALDLALRRFGNDDALWATKAAILQGAGESRAAFECLAPRAERPQAPPALLVRAGLSALDPARAVSLAQRALGLLPHSAPARNLLAAAQLGVGDPKGALENCESLLLQTPDDQYLIALQSTALRLLGDARYARLCDYERLILPLQIEPPAPWKDLPGFLAELSASLDPLHDPAGHALLFQSLRHGTETTQDLTRSADPVVRALFAAFAAPIGRYLTHIGEGADPLRRRNRGRWRFNGSWSVRLRDRGFHASHVHPRGWISSAFYVDLPDVMAAQSSDEGMLSFGKPGILTSPPVVAQYSVRPRRGMLVLFPSYFWHGTIPFHSPQPRLTVAFDAVPQI